MPRNGTKNSRPKSMPQNAPPSAPAPSGWSTAGSWASSCPPARSRWRRRGCGSAPASPGRRGSPLPVGPSGVSNFHALSVAICALPFVGSNVRREHRHATTGRGTSRSLPAPWTIGCGLTWRRALRRRPAPTGSPTTPAALDGTSSTPRSRSSPRAAGPARRGRTLRRVRRASLTRAGSRPLRYSRPSAARELRRRSRRSTVKKVAPSVVRPRRRSTTAGRFGAGGIGEVGLQGARSRRRSRLP